MASAMPDTLMAVVTRSTGTGSEELMEQDVSHDVIEADRYDRD